MKKYLLLMTVVLAACSHGNRKAGETATGPISEAVVKNTVERIQQEQPSSDPVLLNKGVTHAASLWKEEDGTAGEFTDFASANYISDPQKRRTIFLKISDYFESLNGNMNEITLDLRKVLDESVGEIDEIDRMFGNYSTGANLQSDFYANKIAFVIALNFQ
jgi:hypothetical protein